METSTNQPLFSVADLRVSYGFRTAVEGVTLSLTKGQSLGLLGVNGAGKTTTIKALLGMVKGRKGTVEIFGEKPGSTSSFKRIGFAPEDGVPPEYLTGKEYLGFVGSFRVSDKEALKNEVGELLEWFELEPSKTVRDYSKGMKKRLVMAQAFVGNPEFLILDEPLNGLDPLMIIKLREKLEKYKSVGGSILYSSHILSEVEKSCSDIAILNSGKLVYQASLPNLLSEFESVENAFSKKVKNVATI